MSPSGQPRRWLLLLSSGRVEAKAEGLGGRADCAP
jgi:hypothetical protein